jgi:translation initiation factor IF-1
MAAAAAAAAAVVANMAAAAAVAVVTVTKPECIFCRGDVLMQRRPVPLFVEFFMEEHIEIEGRILTVLAGTMFRVELDNKHQVLATISGKMRKRFVRLTVGDRVKMEMSQYDLNKARIVWRLG